MALFIPKDFPRLMVKYDREKHTLSTIKEFFESSRIVVFDVVPSEFNNLQKQIKQPKDIVQHFTMTKNSGCIYYYFNLDQIDSEELKEYFEINY